MILNVTPGINLNAVSGPISKSQINQLGQPVVTLSPGSVVAADTNFNLLRIEDGSYPFLQLTNTGAPTDKKRVRAYVETSGTTGLARVNDAENVGTNLIAWDVNNSAYFAAPVNVSGFSSVASFFGSPGGAQFFGLRLIAEDASAAQSRTAFVDIANETGTNAASMWVEVAADGSSNMRLLTTPAGSRSSDRRVERVRVTGDGKVGIGTTNTPSNLTVAGDIRLLNNGNALLFTDTGGTTPYMVSAVDGNFYFTGTTAAGAASSVFRCAMRATNSPLQIDRPLKIGASGSEIKKVLKAVANTGFGTFTADQTLYFTRTMTGVSPGDAIFVTLQEQFPANFSLDACCDQADVVKLAVTNTKAASNTWTTPSFLQVTLTALCF